jgi:uncharacterized protein YrzB (UPF0473 family)
LEEKQILKFMDEDGNMVELEAIAKIYLNKTEYLILAPLDEDSGNEYVYRVDKDKEGKEELNVVVSDEEFRMVKKEYKNLLYNEGGEDE